MKNDKNKNAALNCPSPISEFERITLAHGGGGKIMNQLIERVFIDIFDSDHLRKKHDSAVFDSPPGRLAFTTDSYVVDPIFFPGGDIGALAVNGTVNDLAMSGAKPLYLSVGFIIEEGFALESLEKIVWSMKSAADNAGVKIATGDTKVVEKGRGHEIFINTSGVGIIEHDLAIGPKSIAQGDAVIINRDIGRHGMGIMSKREGLSFESTIESDCAPLALTVLSLIDKNIKIHCLRDLTRGGLGAALNELAVSSNKHIRIEEKSIPIDKNVAGACEILGLDPIYVANEGAMVLFVASEDADKTVALLRNDLGWPAVVIIGEVVSDGEGLVTLKTAFGAERVLITPGGEQLPRIC
jgi:hydrogenase expression/formation protein HypE